MSNPGPSAVINLNYNNVMSGLDVNGNPQNLVSGTSIIPLPAASGYKRSIGGIGVITDSAVRSNEGRRIAITGDSITASINGSPGTGNFGGITESLIDISSGGGGALVSTCIAFLGAQRNTPVGAGTISYTRATNSVTWKAFGDIGAGIPVVMDRTKQVLLTSASIGMGIWVVLRPNGAGVLPLADTVDTSLVIGGSGSGKYPNVQYQTECYADWLKAYLGPSYRVVGKWATSGNRIQNIIDQLPDIYAAGIDEVFVMIGTNDLSTLSVTQICTGLQTIFDYFLNLGVRVNSAGILPRGDLNFQANIIGVNKFVRNYAAGNKSFRYIPLYQYMIANPPVYLNATPYDVDTSLYNTTGGNYLHPSRKGSRIIASTIANLIKDNTLTAVWESPYDLYNATTTPYGTLTTNPAMIVGSGRPGTVAGANVNGNTTGTPPDDYTAWSTGTITGVSSVVTRQSVVASDPLPGNYWKMNITAAGTGIIRLFSALSLVNIQAGDLIELWGDCVVDNPSLITRFDCAVEFNGADRVSFGQYTGDQVSTETTLTAFPIASPTFRVPDSFTWNGQTGNPNPIRCFLNLNASAAANVYVGNLRVVKVPQ